VCSQPSHFEVLSVHNDVIETKKDWEPVLDHRILDPDVLRARCSETTFWRIKHDRNDASEHGDCEKADLLVLANFTEVRDANRQICKGTVSDDGGKVLLVQSGDNFKRRACYPFCWRKVK
jgi:hypothetical protein